MNLKAKLVVGALAGTVLFASGAAAMAAPSMASDTTVYSQPQGEEIDSIDRGDDVAVGQCSSGYCFVHDLDDSDTESGWVKSAAIDFVGGNEDDVTEANPVNDNGSLVELGSADDEMDSGDGDSGGNGHHHHHR